MEGGMHLPFLRRIHNTVGGRQSLPPPPKKSPTKTPTTITIPPPTPTHTQPQKNTKNKTKQVHQGTGRRRAGTLPRPADGGGDFGPHLPLLPLLRVLRTVLLYPGAYDMIGYDVRRWDDWPTDRPTLFTQPPTHLPHNNTNNQNTPTPHLPHNTTNPKINQHRASRSRTSSSRSRPSWRARRS